MDEMQAGASLSPLVTIPVTSLSRKINCLVLQGPLQPEGWVGGGCSLFLFLGGCPAPKVFPELFFAPEVDLGSLAVSQPKRNTGLR